MRRALALLCTFLAAPALAEVESFTIDPNHTFPSYEIGHMGVSIQRGRFTKTSGKVTIDTAARTGSLEVVIDAASVDSGHPKLTEILRGENYFNVEKFPTLVFRGNAFTFEGEKVKSVAGELAMLGVSRPVTLTAATFNCIPHPITKKKVCGGDFFGTLKRSEWGITRSLASSPDEVTLKVSVEAVKD